VSAAADEGSDRSRTTGGVSDRAAHDGIIAPHAAPALVLRGGEIRRGVGLDLDALERVAAGFTALAEGRARVPPVMFIKVPERGGEVDVKAAFIEGLDGFAIKIASGFSANERDGLPTASGLMVLLDAQHGFPLAILLDDGYLTDLRTALAGAVAARHLAPARVRTLGIIGTGTQARWQARALRLVRDYERVLVHGRDAAKVERYVAEMTAELGVPVTAAASAEALVRESDIVVTATAARAPLVRAEWLRPGMHITALGSDGAGKQELEPAVLALADRVVCDLKAQCFRIGELQHALAAGLLSETSDAVTELGELTAGRAPGRTRDDEITVCDLTGVGVQDTMIALLARERASRQPGTDARRRADASPGNDRAP
jgi:ectoine utilization protein EutC